MINALKLKMNFLTGLVKPVITTVSEELETNTKNTRLSKINSLAYLSYKNRKQKGLVSNDSECPTIYFGDEWAL
jgi:hypothetical protein